MSPHEAPALPLVVATRAAGVFRIFQTLGTSRALASSRLRAGLLVLAVSLIALPSPAARAAQSLSSQETQRLMRDAEAAMTSARTLLARGDRNQAKTRLDEAEGYFRTILRGDGLHRDAAIGLSQVLFLSQRYDDGVKLLTPIHEAAPEDRDITHQLGLHLFRNGQQAHAVPLLEEIAGDPDRFDGAWLLAVYYYRQAEWSKGLAHAETYVAARPDDVRALALMGTYYLKVARHQDAVATLDRYLLVYPDNTAARINRANALFRMGSLDEAAGAYEDLVKRFPKRARMLYNLAAVRIKQQRCDDAVALLDRFLEHAPESGTALYFKADCLFKLGRYPQARAAFKEAGAKNTSNPWVHYGLSKIALKEGDTAEARQQSESAVRLAGGDWELVSWRGTVMRRTGEADRAAIDHQRAAELAPERALPLSELGRDRWASGDPSAARDAFTGALERDPKLPSARAGFAASQTRIAQLLTTAAPTAEMAPKTQKTQKAQQIQQAQQTQKLEEARQLLRAVLDQSPDYGPARTNLALLEARQGRLDAAKALYDDAPLASEDRDAITVLAMLRLLGGDDVGAQAALDSLASAPIPSGGPQLAALEYEVRGHLLARDGEYKQAAAAFEKATADETAPRATGRQAEADSTLSQTRAFVWLKVGLEALSAGDGALARTALTRASQAKGSLTLQDRGTLEFARLCMGILTTDEPARRAAALSKQLKTRQYAGAARASLRDIGHAYVAWGYMRAGQPDGTESALGRIRAPRRLGGTVRAIRAYARDLAARQHFDAGDYAKATRAWQRLNVSASPAISHNLAAARFMSGDPRGAARVWTAQAAAIAKGSPAPAESLYNLAIAADRDGDSAAAMRYFESFLKRQSTGATADTARARLSAKRRVFGRGSNPGAGGGL